MNSNGVFGNGIYHKLISVQEVEFIVILVTVAITTHPCHPLIGYMYMSTNTLVIEIVTSTLPQAVGSGAALIEIFRSSSLS